MKKQFYTILWIALLCSFSKAFSQAYYLLPINKGLVRGNITYAVTPFDLGDIHDVFDSSETTLARSAEINPMVITLGFETSIPLVRTRILSGTDGTWTVEIAQTLEDLDQKAGTYQKVIDFKPINGDSWDEYYPETHHDAKFVRLSLVRTVGDDYVHLREWELYSYAPRVSNPSICPTLYFLKPGFTKKFSLQGIDTFGFPMDVSHQSFWSSSDTNVATVDSIGVVKAKTAGTATISAYYEESSFESTIQVGSSFTPLKAPKKTVKVALLIEDPFVPGSATVRWHDKFGWKNPTALAQQLVKEMNDASHHTVEFQISQTTYGDLNFTTFDGQPVDSSFFYHRYLTKEGTDSLLYWAGDKSLKLRYNYNALLDFYPYCVDRENGAIDEVWVFSHPAAGLYESTLAGENAFNYNSPPVVNTPCIKLLPIMGFNHAVNVEYAMHSIGHRAESVMSEVYGGWDTISNPAKTHFDLFTRIEKQMPGLSQVGSIHFPPNAMKDYAYESYTAVYNRAHHWSQYPLMENDSLIIDCTTWDCSQLGYMRWWHEHLPHYQGITDGVLNDWWHYIVHYEDAVAYAKTLDPGCGNLLPHDIYTDMQSISEQQHSGLHPNPSKGILHVRLKNNSHATLYVFDSFGKRIDNPKEMGNPENLLDLGHLPKGMYLYKITYPDGKQDTGKFILE